MAFSSSIFHRLVVGLVLTLYCGLQICQAIRVVPVGSSTNPTLCDGYQRIADIEDYVNNTCTIAQSDSVVVTCYPDGSRNYSVYLGSHNCTRLGSWANGYLPPGSINQCMPEYLGNYNYYIQSLIVVCDGSGTPVTSSPEDTDFHSDSRPLTNDTYITNVEYYTSANCSGVPRSTFTNITNGGCLNDPLGPGTAQRLSCRHDTDYGNFQYVAVWAGQASLGVPNNCPPRATNFDEGDMWGYRTSNYGQCITLWVANVPYGSYKFICPSMVPAPVSSSSSSGGGGSSTASATPSSSSSSASTTPHSSSSSSTIGSTAVGSSSTGSTTGDSSSTGSNASYGFIQYQFSIGWIGALILFAVIGGVV